MIKCNILSSGSKGNAIYVEVDGVPILLDAGITYKQLTSKMVDISKHVVDIKYVFISHEHGDHNRSVNQFDNNYTTIFSEKKNNISHGNKKCVGIAATVTPIKLLHDESCHGYVVEDSSGNKLVYITDTVEIPCSSLKYMLDPAILIVEANHDLDMLYDNTKYPDDLKDRVAETHMENSKTNEIIQTLNWFGLEYVVCHHLSEKNNSPAFARYEAETALGKDSHCDIIVAEQNEVSKMMVVI